MLCCWNSRIYCSSSQFNRLFYCQSFTRNRCWIILGTNSCLCKRNLTEINQQKRRFWYFWTAHVYYWFHGFIWNQYHSTWNRYRSNSQMEAGHQFKFLRHFDYHNCNRNKSNPWKSQFIDSKRKNRWREISNWYVPSRKFNIRSI